MRKLVKVIMLFLLFGASVLKAEDYPSKILKQECQKMLYGAKGNSTGALYMIGIQDGLIAMGYDKEERTDFDKKATNNGAVYERACKEAFNTHTSEKFKYKFIMGLQATMYKNYEKYSKLQ